jgi:hypothetical protein
MQHLAVDKFEYPDVFEKKNATHVVTGVLYGAEAFFVFDCRVAEKEKFRDIHGRMEVMIKKIPSITVLGDGKLDLKDTEISKVNRFQCQYHGDILLPENPTTFQEAVKVYKQLSQIMQHEGKGSTKVVPKKVWLYPLSKLDSRAAQLVREVSPSLVTQAQKLIEDLRQNKIQALDLTKSEASNSFHGVQEHLTHFIEMITEYEMEIAKKLSVALPQVRGGGAEETKLATIFQEYSASPFNQHSLSTWLQGKEEENKMLQRYLTGMQSSSIQFVFDPGELNAIVADVYVDNILCFEFHVAGDRDHLLESMFKYLHLNEVSKENKGVTSKPWFHNKAITSDIKTKMRAFVSFAIANGSTENTKFVVTSSCDEDARTDKGADIVLYSDGQLESYEPPGKPGKPNNSNTRHDSVTLSWSKPQYGAENVNSYIIMYQEVGSDHWDKYVTNENSTSAILSGLEPESAYQVKVCGQSDVGYTQESDTSDHMKTKKSPDDQTAIHDQSDIGNTQESDTSDHIKTKKLEDDQTAIYAQSDIGNTQERDTSDHIKTKKSEDDQTAICGQSSIGVTQESDTSDNIKTKKSEDDQTAICGQSDIGNTQESDTNDHIKTKKSDDRTAIYGQSSTGITHRESDTSDQIKTKKSEDDRTVICGQSDIGNTQESDTSDHIKTKKSPDDRLALLFKEVSTCIGLEKGGHKIYKIPLFDMPSKTKGIAKCTIGNPRDLTLEFPEKVLLLVGATGSGKSTLINGIANYVLGVRWEDDFRFKLIAEETSKDQTKSVTQTITSYSFPRFDGSPLDFRLTVIDTPGFGDTGGLERDEEITALIKDFFSIRGPEGIDHIDGIGFVAQSPLVRLTHTQKYVIDSILAVFGKDIAGNIFLMTTFADGAYPPVVDAIKTHITESNPPVPINTEQLLYFKFNNSALFTKPKDPGKTTFDEMYWNVGCTSLNDFFSHLLIAKEKTLQLTRAVLDERQKLQALVQGVQQDVHRGMNAIDEMRQEKQVLEANEAKIQANKDFTYQTTEYHQKKVNLPSRTYVTNCLYCNHTCHYPCAIPKDSDKRGCAAMDSNGYCEVCPNHCFWNPHHVNSEFRYEDEPVTVTKHYADLEKKYKDAEEGKATAHSMILKIRERVENTFQKMCNDISKAKQCLERLEEIALKPNPLTEVQYIDILIKSETNEAKPGWEKRVKCLENARKMAEIMAGARKGEVAKDWNLEAMMDDLLKDVPVRPVQKSRLGELWTSAKTTANSMFNL